MRSIVFLLSFMSVGVIYGQNIGNKPPTKSLGYDLSNSSTSDSTKIKPQWYRLIYARVQPFGIYTGSGYLKDRINQNAEVGYSFGMIDAGVAVGRNALRRDSLGNGNVFLEGKMTMDVCQYGIFSNEMTIGAGYVFNSQTPLMLELSYTIYAQFWKNVGIGFVTGFYDFSGDYSDSYHNTFGIYLRYGLLREESGGLLNIGRMIRMHRMARGH